MMEKTAKRPAANEVLMGLKWETLPEDELILLVQKGSGEAFVELASRYLPLIHRMASPYRSSFLEAEDLSQEGLLGLFAAAGGYRRDRRTSFSAYAAAWISNRILSAYRKACSKKNAALRESVPLEEEEAAQPEPFFGDPEALLIRREALATLLEKFRRSLTPREREALAWYAAGYSYRETAQRLGVSVKSVEGAIQRARKKLRAVV